MLSISSRISQPPRDLETIQNFISYKTIYLTIGHLLHSFEKKIKPNNYHENFNLVQSLGGGIKSPRKII